MDASLGKSGLEYSCDEILRSHPFPLSFQGLKDRWEFEKPAGHNIILTLDMELTRSALKAMRGKKGSVVVIKPSTGEILVMVSNPGINPNLIKEKWSSYSKDGETPLLNRCLQGEYPPGSIFKILIAGAALEEGIIDEDDTFYCPGYIEVEGHRFHCSHSHGTQTLREAMANSCNVAFAEIGLMLGEDKLLDYYNKFFNSPYSLPLPLTNSKLENKNISTKTLLAQTAFGQGELTITPLEAAFLAMAVANKGKIMKPFLIKEVRDMNNRLIEKTEETEMVSPLSEKTAAILSDMMEAVIEEGTGYMAAVPGIRAGGKTGTAEQPSGPDHAWFIGFAPVENPEIALAVIVEEGGFGGEAAAPVAGEIILKAMRE